MILPDAPWQHSDGMERLLDALDAKRSQTRYVGGCVRDTLVGLPVSDVDLATRLLPDDVTARLERAGIRAVPTGLLHGTITAVVQGRPVEVTTLRRDVSTDGRRATVAFTDDWREDAARRDFTINALSADPSAGEIFDYFDGVEDVTNGKVRFIGDPLQRIAEDHLRILRFFRFHARYGSGGIDEPALAACTARANDLMALSRERIADELLKLLALPEPTQTVRLMVERGILRPVLPQIDESGVERLGRLARREQDFGVTPDGLRRLAALMPPDPAVASSVAAVLRLSNKARKRLTAAADHARPLPADPRHLAYEIGGEEAVDRMLLAGEDEGLAAKVETLKDWKKPRLPITGGQLIAMGLAPGPSVAAVLQAVEKEWVLSGFPDDVQSVERIARRRVGEQLRPGSSPG